ncbi:MAG: glycosyltransferase family 2 protein [Bacteroidota bacterium]
MKISVIIPTYNGAKRIVNLLEALESQTYKDFETIIVIDGSTDQTKEVLSKRETTLSSIQVVDQPNKGRAGARNTGIKQAKGEIILFFDDDIRPNPRCIEQHLRFHQQRKNSILVGACIHGNSSQKLIDKYRAYTENIWSNKEGYSEKKEIQISKDQIIFTTQNLSIPAHIFEEAFYFNENLTDSEDFELCVRLLNQNFPIFFNQNAYGYHDDYKSLQEYIHRQREYLIARKALALDKPEYVKLYPKQFERVTSKISPSKLAISRFFEYNRLWEGLVHSKFLTTTFSEKYIYKLIDTIIFASTTCYISRKT